MGWGGKGGGGGRRKVLSLCLLVRERAEAVAEAHGSMLITLLLVLSHPQTMRSLASSCSEVGHILGLQHTVVHQ